MTLRARTGAAVLSGVAATVLSAGAVAWACTPYESDSAAAKEYLAQNPPQSQDTGQPPAPQPQPAPQAQTQAAPESVAPAPASAPVAVVTNRSSSTRSDPARSPAASPSGAAQPAPPPVAPTPVVAPNLETANLLPSSTASGELWAGFGSAANSTATRGPSLAATSSANDRSTEWGLGVGLLAVGTLVLAAGTVTAARRQKAPANL